MTVQSGRCSPCKSPASSSGAGVEHGTCQSQKGGGAGRWYHRLLWICGSAVHWAAASACCTDAVLSGASGTCVCEGWWALEEPQGRPDLDGIIDALQKWMFDHLRVDLFRPLRLGGSTGMSGHSPRPSDRRQHLSCGVERRSSDVSSPQTVGSCSCSCNSVKLVLVRESMSQCDG